MVSKVAKQVRDLLLKFQKSNDVIVFENIDIRKLLPPNSKLFYDGEKIQELWDSFFKIICCLKADTFSEAEVNSLKDDIWSWFLLFLETYQASDVTPYIHAFVFHVPEFLLLHGNINFFNQQGLEKLNDVSTKNFFRGTNMRDNEALKQLFAKRCRVQLLEDQGFERIRRDIHCHNCGMTDHNILKCMTPCTNCFEPICSAHLVKTNGVHTRKCLLDDEDL